MLPNAISGADVAAARDAQHAVVVPVCDQEPAAVLLCSAYWTPLAMKKSRRGRIRDRPRADVRDRRRAAVLLDPVDAVDDVGLPEGRPDQGDEHVRGATDEGDIDRSADADFGDRRGQTASRRS